MAELLLELLSEEIPARMQARAADDLKRLVAERLKAADIAFDTAVAHVTPRRLVLVVDGLPERQPDRTEERKGPRVGAPDKAIEGFLRSVGLDSLDGCEQRAVGNATFWVVLRRHEGRAVAEVLPELLAAAIGDMPWPKSMRWADTTARWVRPLHSIVALLDGRPLTGGHGVGGTIGTVPFGDTTRGHRFHAPAPFEVTGFADYAAKLRAAHVMLDAAERRDLILAGARSLCAAAGLELLEDGGLLDEVAGLVEWPVPLMGAIDPAFMDVPPEVLTTAMRTHQRYFSVRRSDGTLAPRFVLVANIEAADGGAAVVAGNERVLRARLSDAKFFWGQDRNVRLEDRLPALDGVVFHAKLGSVGDKVRRLESLAVTIAAHIPGADSAAVATAARLAKADLGSGMVGEFPELQGVMGRYYAHGEGQPEAVAEAIAQHYSPLGPNDSCPSAPEAVAVALADKIDTLAGFFAVGEKPTGSRDPYALRRAALGVIRLVLENGLRLPLAPVFAAARDGYGTALRDGASGEAVAADLLDFLADRLKVHLRERGVRHDLVAAVFALGGQDDLVRLLARVDALAAFAASDDGANLLVAYRRASNILAIEEKKDGVRYGGAPNPARFVQDEEAALASALERAAAASAAALAAEDFPAAMAALASLRGPVDDFFEKVTVNADDRETRANRLRLLSGIRDAMGGVADFSKFEG